MVPRKSEKCTRRFKPQTLRDPIFISVPVYLHWLTISGVSVVRICPCGLSPRFRRLAFPRMSYIRVPILGTGHDPRAPPLELSSWSCSCCIAWLYVSTGDPGSGSGRGRFEAARVRFSTLLVPLSEFESEHLESIIASNMLLSVAGWDCGSAAGGGFLRLEDCRACFQSGNSSWITLQTYNLRPFLLCTNI